MATLTRFEPFRDVSSLNDEVERVFRQTFGAPGATSAGAFSPALDVEESEDGFTLHVELPGISADDVEVSLEENVLTIAGERALLRGQVPADLPPHRAALRSLPPGGPPARPRRRHPGDRDVPRRPAHHHGPEGRGEQAAPHPGHHRVTAPGGTVPAVPPGRATLDPMSPPRSTVSDRDATTPGADAPPTADGDAAADALRPPDAAEAAAGPIGAVPDDTAADADQDAAPAEPDPRSAEELLAALVAAESQRDEFLDDLRRARADFENYRQRTTKEAAGARETGRADVAAALFDVLDDLDRTVEATDGSSDEVLAKGVTLVADKLARTLRGAGHLPHRRARCRLRSGGARRRAAGRGRPAGRRAGRGDDPAAGVPVGRPRAAARDGRRGGLRTTWTTRRDGRR